MAIRSDFHLHSSFSGDSDTPMENMILKGIDLGLTHMCFTEHNDFGFPACDEIPKGTFELNADAYLYDLLKYRDKYKDKINILFGVELGLQPHLMRQNALFAKAHDYDFIIGSSHTCNKKDPYYPPFYEGRTEEEAYREYYQSVIDNIKKFSNFDVYGHLDYVLRYGPNKAENFTYEKYQDLLDTILKLLIENGKGIELNTGGILPTYFSIVKRYKELGGEIITIGSDAHAPENMANNFNHAEEILKDCGFKYYTIFEKRLPEFKKL